MLNEEQRPLLRICFHLPPPKNISNINPTKNTTNQSVSEAAFVAAILSAMCEPLDPWKKRGHHRGSNLLSRNWAKKPRFVSRKTWFFRCCQGFLVLFWVWSECNSDLYNFDLISASKGASTQPVPDGVSNRLDTNSQLQLQRCASFHPGQPTTGEAHDCGPGGCVCVEVADTNCHIDDVGTVCNLTCLGRHGMKWLCPWWQASSWLPSQPTCNLEAQNKPCKGQQPWYGNSFIWPKILCNTKQQHRFLDIFAGLLLWPLFAGLNMLKLVPVFSFVFIIPWNLTTSPSLENGCLVVSLK